MSRAEFIKRIRALSNDEFERVAPRLEKDLEALEYHLATLRQVERGRESARGGRVRTTDEVMARIRARRKRA